MFGCFSMSPKYVGDCSCEDLQYGNKPIIKTTLSPGLAAAMRGWNSYCIIKDYDELAKEEAAKEGGK